MPAGSYDGSGANIEVNVSGEAELNKLLTTLDAVESELIKVDSKKVNIDFEGVNEEMQKARSEIKSVESAYDSLIKHGNSNDVFNAMFRGIFDSSLLAVSSLDRIVDSTKMLDHAIANSMASSILSFDSLENTIKQTASEIVNAVTKTNAASVSMDKYSDSLDKASMSGKSADATFNSITAAMQKNTEASNALVGSMRSNTSKTAKAYTELSGALNNVADNLDGVAYEAKTAVDRLDYLNATMDNMEPSLYAIRKDMLDVRTIFDRVQDPIVATAKDMSILRNRFQDFDMKAFKKSMKNMESYLEQGSSNVNELRRDIDKLGDEFIEASKKSDRFNDEVKSGSTRMNMFSHSILPLNGRMLSFASSLSQVAMGFQIMFNWAQQALRPVQDFLTLGLERNIEIEKTVTQFDVFLRDGEQALELMQQLRAEAQRTPYDLEGLSSGMSALLSRNMEVDDSLQVISMLENIAQGDSQRLQTMATAMGRMYALGSARLEYTNMLNEAGFDPFSTISAYMLRDMPETTEQEKALKKSQSDELVAAMRQRTTDGEFTYDELLASMILATSNYEGFEGNFVGMMDKVSETVYSLQNNLQEGVQNFSATFMEGFYASYPDLLHSAIDFVDELDDSFRKDGFKGIKSTIDKWLPVFASQVDEIARSIFGDSPVDFVENTFDKLVYIFSTAERVLSPIAGSVFRLASSLIGSFASLTGLDLQTPESVGGFLDAVSSEIVLAIDRFTSYAPTILDLVWRTASWGWNLVSGTFERVIELMSGVFETVTSEGAYGSQEYSSMAKLFDSAKTVVEDVFGLIDAIVVWMSDDSLGMSIAEFGAKWAVDGLTMVTDFVGSVIERVAGFVQEMDRLNFVEEVVASLNENSVPESAINMVQSIFNFGKNAVDAVLNLMEAFAVYQSSNDFKTIDSLSASIDRVLKSIARMFDSFNYIDDSKANDIVTVFDIITQMLMMLIDRKISQLSGTLDLVATSLDTVNNNFTEFERILLAIQSFDLDSVLESVARFIWDLILLPVQIVYDVISEALIFGLNILPDVGQWTQERKDSLAADLRATRVSDFDLFSSLVNGEYTSMWGEDEPDYTPADFTGYGQSKNDEVTNASEVGSLIGKELSNQLIKDATEEEVYRAPDSLGAIEIQDIDSLVGVSDKSTMIDRLAAMDELFESAPELPKESTAKRAEDYWNDARTGMSNLLGTTNSVTDAMEKVAPVESRFSHSVSRTISGYDSISTATSEFASKIISESEKLYSAANMVQVPDLIEFNPISNFGNTALGSIDQYAKGTDYASGGMSLVGEEGPEILDVPRGSQVHANDDLRNYVSAKASSPNADITVNITINMQGGGDAESLEQLKSELYQEVPKVLSAEWKKLLLI